MGPMQRVAIVSEFSRAFDPHADPRNVSMVRRRHAWWDALRVQHGLPLALLDAADVRTGAATLADTRAAWIDLPMLPRASYRALWRALVEHAPYAQVRDAPDDVAAVLGLDHIVPRLLASGLPTPRTALLPLAPATIASIAGPDDVRRELLSSIYAALDAVALDPHDGLYVRGFYSSAKSPNPALWFARNQHDVVETVTALIGHLRGALEVGGLALRAFHALARVRLPAVDPRAGTVTVPFEFRVTVLGGRAIGVSYHGPYEVLADHQRDVLDDALRANGRHRRHRCACPAAALGRVPLELRRRRGLRRRRVTPRARAQSSLRRRVQRPCGARVGRRVARPRARGGCGRRRRDRDHDRAARRSAPWRADRRLPGLLAAAAKSVRSRRRAHAAPTHNALTSTRSTRRDAQAPRSSRVCLAEPAPS